MIVLVLQEKEAVSASLVQEKSIIPFTICRPKQHDNYYVFVWTLPHFSKMWSACYCHNAEHYI